MTPLKSVTFVFGQPKNDDGMCKSCLHCCPCRTFAEERAAQLGTTVYELTGGSSRIGATALSEEEQRREWREQRASFSSEEHELESSGGGILLQSLGSTGCSASSAVAVPGNRNSPCWY
jgi:hypothetical protein